MTKPVSPVQQPVTLEDINKRIWEHLCERDWHKGSSRALAISLSLEASELLEHYQWSEESVGGTQEVAEELADVFIYGFQIAQQNNIDLADAINKKLDKAAKKYPAENFKGKTATERRKSWIENKVNYKKETAL